MSIGAVSTDHIVYRPKVFRVNRRSNLLRPTVITPGCMTGRPWYKSEERLLAEKAMSHAIPAIAEELGRTPNAVAVRARLLGLSLRRRRANSVLCEQQVQRARLILEGCPASMRSIIRAVSEARGVSVEAILGHRRLKPCMLARREMIWTVARDTKMSMNLIATKLGLDHTTVRHAIHKEDAARGTDVRLIRTARKCL